MRVWELRSRQAVRVIAAPDNSPVTGLLVLDRPATLASGQGRHGAASSAPGALDSNLRYLQLVLARCSWTELELGWQPCIYRPSKCQQACDRIVVGHLGWVRQMCI